MDILRAKQLTKIYGQPTQSIHKALDRFDLTIEQGEFVAIMGPSGSGKTTLLQLLGTIDLPSSGEIFIRDIEVSKLSGKQLAAFRREHLGFIFQDFHLMDALTLEENMIVPLALAKRPVAEIEMRVAELAKQLGIEQVLQQRPYEVSGGQKQRAAAARALIHQPDLILADEPTGNLDSKSAKALMTSLADVNRSEQATILTVTHDPFTASYCQRVIFIKDGKLFNELRRGADRGDFFQQIMQVLSRLGGESHAFTYDRS